MEGSCRKIKVSSIRVLPLQCLTASRRASGQRQQALYCTKRAVAVDPNDVNLLWEHAMMAKEFGEDEVVSPG